MSHARSGLPPLNLEPFDPTPLYAAARSPRRDKQPPHKEARRSLLTGLVATVLLGLGVAAALFLS